MYSPKILNRDHKPAEGGSAALQKSASWNHIGLGLNNNNNELQTQKFSVVSPSPATSKPSMDSSTFWKSITTGKVPGSIKVIHKTPPRPVLPGSTNTPSENSTLINTQNILDNQSAPPSPSLTPSSSLTPSPSLTPSSSENNSPNGSPSSISRSASRSKSTSSLPEPPSPSPSPSPNPSLSSSSSGVGEFVHHCLEWKTCGRVGDTTRLNRFKKILSNSVIDMEELKKNCWKGIPGEVRGQCWKLLLGYLPANSDRREATLARKRKEYHDNVAQYYGAAKTDADSENLKQIQKDLPRTNPDMPLFQQTVVQQILERVLYTWALRHPASGYVQGINDIATPFFVVFLSEFVDNIDEYDSDTMGGDFLNNVEADTYWCLSKFLDGVQDYFTFSQPGIQRMTFKLHELVGRVDHPLTRHLQANEVQFMHFSMRWMNCILVREFPLALVARMWDTYLAEGESFSVFHLYVCAAFLKRWSASLRLLDFQGIFMFLQRPPTHDWTCRDIELMLSEAYLWMETFQNAPAHLKSSIA